MDHIAIMRKSWKLIPKILSGEKSIESRWYRTRRAPWGKIASGDRIFFKNAGEPVTAKAVVSDVFQFEIKDVSGACEIIKKYGREICLVSVDPEDWDFTPKYCVLMRLIDAENVTPFDIDKSGFGIGAAWMTIPDISKIIR
jgi:ASC-1-like (ASCH) protein